ncbi:MAG TPA: peptidase M3A and M3B thimet/oligopeptidase F [Acidimicrobiia bacterium]|jgi:peptidyl-dipeptidase A|nr:peptidase M3A and M3B thimet/oligopeptidase F [Acidimicrobiia bacterium]
MNIGDAPLVTEIEERLRPLVVAAEAAWWDAAVDARDETEARRKTTDLAVSDVLAEPELFGAVRAARSQAGLDPTVARQLDVVHDWLAPNQVPSELRRAIVDLQVAVESEFAQHRGEVDGEQVDDNEITEILRTSDDVGLRERAWEASKTIGAAVADRLRELARRRNEAARALGWRDHFALALGTSELDEDRLFATLTAVDDATAAPFRAWKSQLDVRLADRFGIAVRELAPWHYDDPFFQTAPVGELADLDAVFAGRDLEALVVRSYEGLGLDVAPVLTRSDLYPRERKNQHAFCTDIDREGDVRVLCNITPSERWMETLLHEFGHGTYFAEVDRTLPWTLRTMHSLTTEGVAMLFGRRSRDPEWLTTVVGVAPAEVERRAGALADARRAQLLVFARWVLVMTNFERGLYADPNADHDNRWWELVERFQLVHRPPGRVGPDWAAKIHLAVAPVYYQNYLYGELVASQVEAMLRREHGGLVDRPDVGRTLRDRIFRPGAAVRWDELIRRATGEPLTPKHLAAQLA